MGCRQGIMDRCVCVCVWWSMCIYAWMYLFVCIYFTQVYLTVFVGICSFWCFEADASFHHLLMWATVLNIYSLFFLPSAVEQ